MMLLATPRPPRGKEFDSSGHAQAYRESRAAYEHNRDADRDQCEPPYLVHHKAHTPGAYTDIRAASWDIHGVGVGLLQKSAQIHTAGVPTVTLNMSQHEKWSKQPTKARLLHEYVPAPEEYANFATVDTYEENKLLRRILKPKSSGLVLEPAGASYLKPSLEKPMKASAERTRNLELSEENRRLRHLLHRISLQSAAAIHSGLPSPATRR
mmetsp:Transcript_20821/g.61597  ORF Transcript_20821/g.61597 Transcript_20821/m.61597 type:complete len:210 (-) Transcript_20821:149-778(-)